MTQAFSYLVLTVLFEILGTSCIQASQQFSRPLPSIGVVLGYGISFWFLSLALKTLPLAVVYATWSGMGIVLIAGVGWLIFGQKIDMAAALGLAMIAGGIVVLHLYGTTAV
ncbi:MAG: DMT family transporter [Paracoccaceae bacterium]